MGGRSMQKMKTMAITVSVLFFALAHPATPEDVIPEDFSLPEVVGGNSPNDDTAFAEAIEGRADQVVPEEELPQSAANRRDLVKQIKHCEDCINTMLEGIAQAYRECAERTEAKCEEGLDSHDGRDVVALIESEAAKATTYDVALYPEAKAAADEQKTEFDGKFGQIKARFESCANDKAQCIVSEFNRDITHLLSLTKFKVDKEDSLEDNGLLQTDLRGLRSRCGNRGYAMKRVIRWLWTHRARRTRL